MYKVLLVCFMLTAGISFAQKNSNQNRQYIIKGTVNGKEITDTVELNSSFIDQYNQLLRGNYFISDKPKNDSVFDQYGNLVMVKLGNDFYGASIKRFNYDEKGRLIETIGYDNAGKIKPFFEYCAIKEFEYDNKGNIIEERNKNQKGEFVTTGAVPSIIQKKYDDNTNLIEIIYLNHNRKLCEGLTRIVKKYDNKNNLIKTIKYNSKGQIIK